MVQSSYADMVFNEQKSSKGYSQQLNMKPDAIDAGDMSEGQSSDEFSTKKAHERAMRAERKEEKDEEEDDDGFLILDAPKEVLVVDVFLGEERKLVQLPARLARGLATILLNAPERSTKYTPADGAMWQSLALDGWWKELIKTENVSSGTNQTYHVTESLSLPQIGVDRYNALKEWVKGKAAENLNRAGRNEISEDQAKVSRRRLHLELWTMLDEFSYEKNVRASSEGVETESDPDDDVGEAHGGGNV